MATKAEGMRRASVTKNKRAEERLIAEAMARHATYHPNAAT